MKIQPKRINVVQAYGETPVWNNSRRYPMHSGIMLADETSKLQKYIPRRRLNEAKQRMINSIAL
jgi:hypothetical protein